MVVRKKKKSRKLRGRTRTMGWGRVGQHRKSGSRGGFGAVGFHKHKRLVVIKYAPDWYGKHGFTSIQQIKREMKAINIGQLNEIASKLLAENKATIQGNQVVINTLELGFNKVLGRGKVTIPMKIITKEASELAKKKIEKAGGTIILLGEKEEKSQ